MATSKPRAGVPPVQGQGQDGSGSAGILPAWHGRSARASKRIPFPITPRVCTTAHLLLTSMTAYQPRPPNRTHSYRREPPAPWPYRCPTGQRLLILIKAYAGVMQTRSSALQSRKFFFRKNVLAFAVLRE